MKYHITSVYYDIYEDKKNFYAIHYFKKHKVLLKAKSIEDARKEVKELLNNDLKAQLNH